jgi:hypothetical protein
VKARKKERSCDPKQGSFRSREDALAAIAKLSRERGAPFWKLQPYRCTFCWISVNGQRQRPWHFGNIRGFRALRRNKR